MTNSISFITGIQDEHLKFDKPRWTQEKGVKVIHLIQSYPMHCPHCGRLMKRNGFRKAPVIIKVIPINGYPTRLSIKKQQYLCPASKDCPKTITRVAQVQGIKPGCRIANTVKYLITQELAKTISMKDIASLSDVSTNTVARQLKALEANFKVNRRWLPSTIAFDDFASGKFAKSGMSMILMNPMNHRTIDIIQSRNSRFMKTYFLSHYSKKARWSVRVVVVDLYEPYRNLIHELFPKAMIVADHFHVVVQAYRALQATRIKVMKQYGNGSHEYRALKRYWKLLLADSSKLDDLHFYNRANFRHALLSNGEVVDRLLNFSPELENAYGYYQAVLQMIHFGDQKLLDRLCETSTSQLSQSMRRVKRVLVKHKQEILNSFQTRLTNGPIEGTNNKIKVIKRVAFGFRNFFHFRIRILLALKNSNIMIQSLPKEKARPIRQAA